MNQMECITQAHITNSVTRDEMLLTFCNKPTKSSLSDLEVELPSNPSSVLFKTGSGGLESKSRVLPEDWRWGSDMSVKGEQGNMQHWVATFLVEVWLGVGVAAGGRRRSWEQRNDCSSRSLFIFWNHNVMGQSQLRWLRSSLFTSNIVQRNPLGGWKGLLLHTKHGIISYLGTILKLSS